MHTLLISTNYLPKVGGVEVGVHDLARFLVSKGEQVTLLTTPTSREHQFKRSSNGEVTQLQAYLGVVGSEWRLPSKLLFPVTSTWSIAWILNSLRASPPSLVNLHFADEATLYALVLARCFQIPLVVTLCGADVQYFPFLLNRYRWLLGAAIKEADAITLKSYALLNELHKQVEIPTGKPIEVLPNGVDMDRFLQVEKHECISPYILTLCRLEPKKGVDLVIRAFARLSKQFGDIDLVIGGDGPIRGQLEHLTKECCIDDRVTFLGAVAYDRVPTLISNALMFVLGSRVEPRGNVLLEAMAAGTPVVATNVGGIPELVHSEYNGLLVAPESVVEMEQAMRRLLSGPSLRDELSFQGRILARAEHSWEMVGKRYLQLYHSLL